jgi:hypothetical protein
MRRAKGTKMHSIRKSYIFSIVTVLLLIVTMTSALIIGSVFSKYSDSLDNDYTVDSSSFFFSSDILLPYGGYESFASAFDVKLYNFVGQQTTSYDISYSVSVSEIQTFGNDTVSISDDKNGVLQGGALSTATITVTPHADVLAFWITVAATNGYAKTLSMHFGKEYTVTFDKQSGTGGTDTVSVTYDSPMAQAEAPVLTGYFFDGYYSGTGGTGTKYYDAAMESVTRYNLTSDATLYANWVLNSPFDGGRGTQADPFRIATWEQLSNVREFLSAYFVLDNNLSAASFGYSTYAGSSANGGLGWDPIGNDTTGRFTGHFDGQGYTVSDLYINRPSQDNVGLFGHIGISASNQPTTIQKIYMTNVNITGARGVGSLVGRVTGNNLTIIQYAGVSGGQVKGNASTGGLVGANNSFQSTGSVDRNPRILNSYANVSVYGIKNIADPHIFEKIGGLVGCSQKGTIINCYSHSSVYADDGASNVGGLVGCNLYRGILQKSYSTGTVTVNNGTNIGGLIGRVGTDGGHVPVSDCYWDVQSSGMPLGSGIGSSADTGVTGLLTAQMQGTNALTNMTALDFVNVWQTVTNNYPVLRAP